MQKVVEGKLVYRERVLGVLLRQSDASKIPVGVVPDVRQRKRRSGAMTHLVESLRIRIEHVKKADELAAAGLVQAIQAAESLEPFEAMFMSSRHCVYVVRS